MKVLFLAPDLFCESGGIARYCRLMYKAMVGSADITKIDIVSLWDKEEDTPDNLDSRVCYKPCSGSKRQFTYSALSLALKHYDICIIGHVNFSPLGQVVKVLSGSSAIVMAYGVDVWSRLSSARRYALAKSDLILAISEYTREKMIESNNIDAQKVKILYNCFDPDLLSQFTSESLSKSKKFLQSPSLITVSRLGESDHYKGHAEVIRSLPSVLEKFPDVNYYIVGKGPLAEKLARISGELRVEEHVHFLGFLDNQSLQCVYRQCDVFIMPSRKEGFGFVFAEAMMYGKPVIAGNQDASVEVVQHNETGLLVDPEDKNQIADAIKCLLADKELQQRMGTKGQEVATIKFNFENFSKLLLGYMKRLLN